MQYYNDYLVIILIVLGLCLIPVIFYILTLQRTLETISPENRKMNPGQVWLILIPFFNLVYNFIMVASIADSIEAECAKLNIPVTENRPTYNIGIAYSVLAVIGGFIPVIGSIAALVCWIGYWVKVAHYKRLLIENKDNFMLDAEREVFHTVHPS